MKILIAYAGKYGSTEKCAVQLSKLINADVTVVNLGRQAAVRAADYDLVVVGSNIRFGQIDRRAAEFVQKQEKEIKKCALFLTAGFYQNKEQYFKENYSKSLLEKTIQKECFGCEVSEAKGLDKWIIRLAVKNISNGIFYEKIEQFAQVINQIEVME